MHRPDPAKRFGSDGNSGVHNSNTPRIDPLEWMIRKPSQFQPDVIEDNKTKDINPRHLKLIVSSNPESVIRLPRLFEKHTGFHLGNHAWESGVWKNHALGIQTFLIRLIYFLVGQRLPIIGLSKTSLEYTIQQAKSIVLEESCLRNRLMEKSCLGSWGNLALLHKN